MDHKVRDLRSALALLESLPGQLIETDVEVDPMAELAGVYRHIGAGGTCMRPTKEGPAMVFHRVKEHPGARHIGAMAERAEELGRRLPISISIGVDPAIEIGSCFEPPTTPMGYDELAVAGALRGEPVELVQCLTVDQKAIANAEERSQQIREKKWHNPCVFAYAIRNRSVSA